MCSFPKDPSSGADEREDVPLNTPATSSWRNISTFTDVLRRHRKPRPASALLKPFGRRGWIGVRLNFSNAWMVRHSSTASLRDFGTRSNRVPHFARRFAPRCTWEQSGQQPLPIAVGMRGFREWREPLRQVLYIGRSPGSGHPRHEHIDIPHCCVCDQGSRKPLLPPRQTAKSHPARRSIRRGM